MRVLIYLCAGVFSYQYHSSVCGESVGLPVCWCRLISISSHINIIGRYVMRVLIYLCAGVFSYQYHRSVCDERVGLPV